MISRAAIYCVLAFGAFAQTPETPPDLNAFREAMKETEPEKKIAALEKWKKEFMPDGTYCKSPWLACMTKNL